jgi:hypothetical protein
MAISTKLSRETNDTVEGRGDTGSFLENRDEKRCLMNSKTTGTRWSGRSACVPGYVFLLSFSFAIAGPAALTWLALFALKDHRKAAVLMKTSE